MHTLWHGYRIWLAVCAGYLIGSVLTADLAARLAGRSRGERLDLRTVGSGNPGGANALANLGRKWGIVVIAGDIAKGAIAALLGRIIAGNAGAYAASAASVAGHCFPAWANFRGGKGLGTSAGTTIVVFPVWVLVDLGLIGATYKFAKQAAMASYITSAAFVLGAWVWYRRSWPNLWGTKPTAGLPMYALAVTAMVYYKFITEPEHMGDRDEERAMSDQR
jgi:glycerol-3-phosphate acyltransferase PlsY